MSPANNPVSTPTRIRKVISEHESQVSELDGELNGLLNLVAQHKSRRAELLKTIAYNKSLIAPIGHLPFEILGMIFVLCIEAQNTKPRHDGERLSKQQILKLILVCRQWKNVAYGTPGAWSRITVGIGHDQEPSPRQIRAPMERAGASPLVFEMVLQQERNALVENSEKHMEEFLEMLEDLKPIFRSVTIREFHPQSGLPGCWRPLLTFVKYLASRPQHKHTLQSFSLLKAVLFADERGPRALDKHETDMLHTAFNDFMALTTLRIPLNVLPSTHPIFGRIKHLGLIGGSDLFPEELSNGVASLLRPCSGLESLTLDFSLFSIQSVDPYSLPRLRKMKMGCFFDIDNFFENVQVPGLEELTIDEIEHQARKESYLRRAFKNLIEQETGAPPLKKLVVADGSVPEKTLVWALEHLPTLVHLEISKSDKFGPKLLAALAKAPTSRKGWLCPDLKRFSVDDCKRVDTESLIGLLQARYYYSTEQAKGALGKGKGKVAEVAARLESLVWNGKEILSKFNPRRNLSTDLSDMSDAISSTDSSDY